MDKKKNGRSKIVNVIIPLRPPDPDMQKFECDLMIHELKGPCGSDKLKCSKCSDKHERKGNELQKF